MLAVVGFGSLAGFTLASVQSSATEQSAGEVTQDSGEGAAIYAANCASCHQAGGTGVPGSFPPLAGNPNAADPDHVASVVTGGLSGPIEVNGETYDSSMPALSSLSEQEVADVSAYVADLAAGGATDAPVEPVAPPEGGDVAAGESLFSGSASLESGGGACVGCHTAGQVGNLGGPGLGPDLTDVAERLGGEAGLSAWLSNPPSPTMMPIFTDRPLTAAEVADLTAFLVDAPSQKAPSRSIDWLGVLGLVGLGVLVAGMAIAYRGMRRTYRERLQARTDRRAAPGSTRSAQ